jgi:hypothetical protein
LIIALDCSVETISSGTEITNGKCTGVIIDQDNKTAVNATVRLIPAGYSPALPSGSTQIDSTTTDHEGRYTFSVPQNDFYNIIAEKGNTSCMQDSVALLTDKPNYLDNDTLEESGWLAGNIQVKPDNDPQQVIVLVLGTNRYTSPVDSLGTIPPLSLPAGIHAVRIFTLENGYDILDTTVTIFPGDTSYLGTRVPLSHAPAINNFAVTFDSVMLCAILQWKPVDTSLFKSYVIYRFVNGVEDSMIMVDKHLSEYVDTCLRYFEDTLVYEITAIGPTFKEGYRAASPPIHVCGKILSVVKTALSNFTLDGSSAFWKICVDADENVYFHDYNSILKIASDGTVLKQISTAAINDSVDATIWTMGSDQENNLYLYTQGHSNQDYYRSVYKLDSDFNTIASLLIPNESVCVYDKLSYTLGELNIVRFGDDGTVYLHSTCDNDSMTTIQVYDADLMHINTFTIPEYNYISYTSNDSIMAIRLEGLFAHPDITSDRSLTQQHCTIFDRSFNLLSSFESVSVLGNSHTSSSLNVWCLSGNYYMAVNEVIRVIGDDNFSYDETIAITLSISDRNGNLIGKHVFPVDFTYQFRKSNLIFGFSNSNGPVLYRITIPDLP